MRCSRWGLVVIPVFSSLLGARCQCAGYPFPRGSAVPCSPQGWGLGQSRTPHRTASCPGESCFSPVSLKTKSFTPVEAIKIPNAVPAAVRSGGTAKAVDRDLDVAEKRRFPSSREATSRYIAGTAISRHSVHLAGERHLRLAQIPGRQQRGMIDWKVLLLLLACAGLLIVLGVAVVLLHRGFTKQPPRIRYSAAIPTWSAVTCPRSGSPSRAARRDEIH